MLKLIFLRHFKPEVDKNKPVSEWVLNEEGKESMNKMLKENIFKDINKIFTSPESKAKITAEEISKKYNIPIIECEYVAEVDRSKVGFIEGDYVKLVESYLTESDFKYEWEDINHVKNRIKKFIEKIEKEEENILIISHGMLLSILLSKYFGKNIIDFWKNLGFGDIIEVDYEKLKEIWND